LIEAIFVPWALDASANLFGSSMSDDDGSAVLILGPPVPTELAEKAWRSVNKEITVGKVTVKVRAFRR
jgi:hypothetical protein